MERLGMRLAGIIRRKGLVERGTGIYPDGPSPGIDSEFLVRGCE
jgi:hypothetical protein